MTDTKSPDQFPHTAALSQEIANEAPLLPERHMVDLAYGLAQHPALLMFDESLAQTFRDVLDYLAEFAPLTLSLIPLEAVQAVTCPCSGCAVLLTAHEKAQARREAAMDADLEHRPENKAARDEALAAIERARRASASKLN